MRRCVRLLWACFSLGLSLAGTAAATPHTAGLDLVLARYRQIAARGGWGSLAPGGSSLRPGDRSAIVPDLRARLRATGDLSAAIPVRGDPESYDAATARAVESFQRRHGLAADGVVGGRTRAALDVPVEARIAQLELARVRLAERPPARRWIRVNIPSFSLELIDSDRTVLAMPVVVGRLARPTPVFESAISSIVLHPAWTVPADLARDVVPKIRRDPGYLARRGFEVFAGADPGAPRLDPKRIDWARMSHDLGEVTLRQRPGSGNGLGRFLFSMENEYDVYLHDTPSRDLFRYDRRDFSSGCIRVADARALARAILRSDDATWSPAHLDAALARRETRRLTIHSPVPVRIVYHTAWIDEHGTAQFREDIYGEDARELAAVRRTLQRARGPHGELARAEAPRRSRHAAAWPFAGP